MNLRAELHALAEEPDFSGVVVASSNGTRRLELSSGLAHRSLELPITIDTRFGIASATKGLTALTIASLIESGTLTFDSPLHSVLPGWFPDVSPDVTIEHLLGHTSGIGDYLDEEALGDVDDYVMDAPVHTLVGPVDYLPMLLGRPQRWEPGTRFGYNNSGFVILSIVAEVVGRRSFCELVRERVLEPAAMADTAFLRSDDLPARAALGYLVDGRTNVLHLPVRGAGDGGAYSTAADIESLWGALFAGRIVSDDMVELLLNARRDAPVQKLRYGLGFWSSLDATTVMLEGMDAGVSFVSAYHRASANSYTVISNTSTGVWPIARLLDDHLAELGQRLS